MSKTPLFCKERKYTSKDILIPHVNNKYCLRLLAGGGVAPAQAPAGIALAGVSSRGQDVSLYWELS